MKYRTKKGCEGLTVHTSKGRVSLDNPTQAQLKMLIQLGVKEVEIDNSIDEEKPVKKSK